VAVTSLQGLIDCLADLARGRLPGTKAQLAERGVSDGVSTSIFGEYTHGIWWPVLRVTFFPRDIFKRLKNNWKRKRKRKTWKSPTFNCSALRRGDHVHPTPLSE
jgi:hypothetical protein